MCDGDDRDSITGSLDRRRRSVARVLPGRGDNTAGLLATEHDGALDDRARRGSRRQNTAWLSTTEHDGALDDRPSRITSTVLLIYVSNTVKQFKLS